MSSRIYDFYKGKSVLITGATGFIGSAIVEKLTRTFDVGKIFLVARTNDKCQNVEEREKEVLKKQIFNKLDNENLKKIKWISGDLDVKGGAISKKYIDEIKNSINVAIHAGASIKLNKPLADTVRTNLGGTLDILEIMKEMKELKCFLYTSTTFSQLRYCNKRSKEEILSHPIHPKTLLHILDKFGKNELNKLQNNFIGDWPMTYAYVKNATENLIQEYESNFPICIFRPAMVGPSYKEPFPGWMEGMTGFYGLMFLAKNKMLKHLPSTIYHKLTMIPVDMTVNAILAAAYKTAIEQSPKLNIYNYSGSETRPNVGDILFWGVKTKDDGLDIIELCNEDEYRKEFAAYEKILKHSSDGDFVYKNLKRSMEQSGQIYEILNIAGDYLTNDIHIDINNIKKLWKELSEEDKKLLPFDVQQINWYKYYTSSFFKDTNQMQ